MTKLRRWLEQSRREAMYKMEAQKKLYCDECGGHLHGTGIEAGQKIVCYDCHGGVNWSTLKHLAISPLRYQYELTQQHESTDIFRIGLGVHCLILEPEKWAERFAVFTGARRQGKEWEEFKVRNAAKEILNTSEYDRIRGCVAALQSRDLGQYLSGSPERPIAWVDEESGLLCKGRPDMVVDGRLVEIKTTGQLEPEKYQATAYRLGYHCQIAHYSNGLIANGHDITQPPVMIVVESVPPHDVIVYEVEEYVVEHGAAEVQRLLNTLASCRRNNSWPGAEPGVVPFHLPSWVKIEDSVPLTSGGKSMEF